MSKFERGIKTKAFLDALNILRKDPNSFWSKMVDDKDLFIAIRKESINVYYQGNSLAKITYADGKLRCATHYKFLINPKLKNPYFETQDDKYQIPTLNNVFISSISNISLIKRSIKVYSGEEKSGVHTISLKAGNVLDVEIALEKENESEDDGRKSTDRIDFLRVEDHKEQLKLVFYEAKHYSNKEIRASGKTDPPVFKQLDKYHDSIKRHSADIISSYKLVCQNLHDLKIIGTRILISKVANGDPLTIDYDPRLVLFGFDRDQKGGDILKFHIDKIKGAIDKRLIIKGKPKSFKTL